MDRQSIFNRDFFPTPVEVIDMMIGLSDVRGKVVLEPSCGSGNIVDYCKRRGAKNVIGCEINDKLRCISQKKCDIIADDFLTVTADMISHVDMILMNPPFSCQTKHILHAYEIAPDGCEIISLCNDALFECWNRDQHSVVKLIELYGSRERVGKVFEHADERATDVVCSVIRLNKPKKGGMEFDDYFSLDADDPEAQGNGLITYSFVREAVQRYVSAVSKFDGVIEAANEINNLTAGIGGGSIKFGAYNTSGSNYTEITRDYFKKELQKSAWKWLFAKFEMQKYCTKGVMADINKFVETQQNVPFTMKNIYKMVELIVGTHSGRMNQVLQEAFDKICAFSSDNYVAVDETWKTNSAHMVNRKFIVPWITDWDSRWPSDVLRVKSWGGNVDDMNDVDKALCFLTGTKYDDGRRMNVVVNDKRTYYGDWMEWGFFRIKGYKKGTMHFEFINEDVWYKFNQVVASSRGWELPTKASGKKRK